MNQFIKFVEEKIAPALIKFSEIRYVQVMQRMGLGIMSLLVIGSIFLIFASFPYEPYLNLLGPFRWVVASGSGVATSIIGILTVITISFGLTEWYNQNRNLKLDIIQPVVLAVASFFLLNPAQTVKTVVEGQEKAGSFSGIPTTYLGALGVFTAIIVGIVTVEIYRLLVTKKIVIKLPDNVPPMVSQSFIALVPSFVVILFWWLVGHVLSINIPQVIQSIFEPLVKIGDTGVAVALASLINRLLWSVGIHGGNIVGSVGGTIWSQMVAANQAAFQISQSLKGLPYTYTSLYMDNYIWTGLLPLAVVMLFSKSPRLKSLGVLALPAALFNIGEPLIFGLPIMMNPILMIPFVLSYVVLAIVSVSLTAFGLLPTPVLTVPWIMPAPIKAFLATNASLWPAIYVLIGWVIMALVFYPFVKLLEKKDLEKDLDKNKKDLNLQES